MMTLPTADFRADKAAAAGWDKDLPMKISTAGSRPMLEPLLLPSLLNRDRDFQTAWGAQSPAFCGRAPQWMWPAAPADALHFLLPNTEHSTADGDACLGVLPMAGAWGSVRKEGRKKEWDDEEVHTAVPSLSSSDDEALSQPPPGLPRPTTVMIRNIPVEYTRSALVQLLDEAGFCGSYDLVYLPMNFRTLQGFGYAFVNMASPQDAKSLLACFDGFCAWKVESDKRCEVSWSNTLQGLSAHVDRYRNSPLMHPSVPDEFKPARYEGSRRVPFPEPTKRVKAPRHCKVGGECEP